MDRRAICRHASQFKLVNLVILVLGNERKDKEDQTFVVTREEREADGESTSWSQNKQVTEQKNLNQTQIQFDQSKKDKGTEEVVQPVVIQPTNQPETEDYHR